MGSGGTDLVLPLFFFGVGFWRLAFGGLLYQQLICQLTNSYG